MLWTQSLYGHSIFALKRWQYPYVLFPRETPASSFVIMLLQVIVAHSVMCGVGQLAPFVQRPLRWERHWCPVRRSASLDLISSRAVLR